MSNGNRQMSLSAMARNVEHVYGVWITPNKVEHFTRSPTLNVDIICWQSKYTNEILTPRQHQQNTASPRLGTNKIIVYLTVI